MTVADATRSPAGTEAAWAYSHLPRDLALNRSAVREQSERIEAAIERVAPGFRDTITARVVQGPVDLQDQDANLIHGAINGGTSAIHQQAIFRPVPGTGRPRPRTKGSTWPAHRRIRAVVCTVPVGGMPPAPPSATTAASAPYVASCIAQSGRGCSPPRDEVRSG